MPPLRISAYVLVLLVLCAGGGSLAAKEKAEGWSAAVAKAVKAFEEKDEAALARLAASTNPDPWILADRLCLAGHLDVAQAIAAQSKGPATKKLGDYVEVCRADGQDEKAWTAIDDASSVLKQRKVQEALKILAAVSTELSTVSRIRAHRMLAQVLVDAHRLPDSIKAFQEASAAATTLGWLSEAANLHAATARPLFFAGDLKRATKELRAASRIYKKTKNKEGEVAVLGNLGLIYYRQDNLQRARTTLLRAAELKRKLGDALGAARQLANIGTVQQVLGEFDDAIRSYEQAIQLAGELGDKDLRNGVLLNLGNVYAQNGDRDRAIALYEDSLRGARAIQHEEQIVLALAALGRVNVRLGRLKAAIGYLAESIVLNKRMGRPYEELNLKVSLADTMRQNGQLEDALELYKEVEAASGKLGLAKTRATAVAGRASVLVLQGKSDEAIPLYKQAVDDARRMRSAPALAMYLTSLAEIHHRREEYAIALGYASEGLRTLEDFLGGLDDQLAAGARADQESLFRIGADCAAKLGDVGECLRFMDSGRAGALLESLGGREALRWAMQDVPEPLRLGRAAAYAAETKTRARYAKAMLDRSVGVKKRRAIGAELDAAVEQVQSWTARIQREAKREAGLLYPRAATVDEVSASLEPGQALVEYSFVASDRPTIALVMTSEEQRIVFLEDAKTIEQAYRAYEKLDASSVEEDPALPLKRLKELLVDPLKLGAETKQLILAPAAFLAYVPYAAILDLPFSLTPSATTHSHLAVDVPNPGTRVLALGDPDYGGEAEANRTVFHRGRKLSPLPGSRKEAKAIGDKVLLGADATQEALVESLAEEERWRAVHFACHGLVNPDKPSLCALVLAEPKEGDAFLTPGELFGLEISTDLAVLSACVTARGKIVGGEGILGLTRSFVYAGSTRVISSLWKVDDEATRTLMVKFYEIWNPREPKEGHVQVPAAEALRQAQEFVRSHEKWKHPYYWAAWVLWGLPS